MEKAQVVDRSVSKAAFKREPEGLVKSESSAEDWGQGKSRKDRCRKETSRLQGKKDIEKREINLPRTGKSGPRKERDSTNATANTTTQPGECGGTEI